MKRFSVHQKIGSRSKMVKSFEKESRALQYIQEHPERELVVEEYVDRGSDIPVYRDEDMMLFPRMHSSRRSPNREPLYKSWSGYYEGDARSQKDRPRNMEHDNLERN